MSDVVNFSFVAKEDDVPAWEKVFSTLEAGNKGAKFQMAMDAFGGAVAQKLEEILESDEFEGPDSFVFEGWSREGIRFSFELDLPYELVEEFQELFELCPVSELNVDVPE